MNKLNNSGWGIGTMISFLIIFIMFLLLVAFFLYHMDHDKDSEIRLIDNNVIIDFNC